MMIKTRLIASGLLALVAIGCGKAKSSAAEEVVEPTPTPVVEVPPPEEVVVPPTVVPVAPGVVPPVAKYWVVSSAGGGRVLAGLSSTGALVKSYDFSSDLTGPITALAFADANNLLMFVDPGAAGETIARINLTTDVVSGNFIVNASLNATTVNDMTVTGGNTLYISKTLAGASVDRFYFDLSRNTNFRSTAPYPIGATVGTCTQSTLNQIIQPLLVNGAQALGIFGSGAASRLNVFGTLDGTFTCANSMSVNAVNLPAATTTIPTGSFFDAVTSKLYVRYTFTAAPQGIYSYDYNVTTGVLSAPAATFVNQGILGASVSSRGLVELDATTMLVPEFSGNLIHKVSKAGVYDGIFHRSIYTTGIAAIAVRP